MPDAPRAAIAHNAGMTLRPLPLRSAAMLCAAVLLASCAGTRPVATGARADAVDAATIIVVRHGEKTSDTERDPDLSDAGLARARALAALLADAELAAILTTDYRRTRQTVQPTAAAHRIAPDT